MAKATAINLLLLDGTASGRVKCSIDGRTGIIFKIPRKDLVKCKDRDELKNDGVYFLLGEEDGHKKIYVGQAASRKNGNGLLNRLKEHDRAEKNFWTEAIVFTTADNSFGATEISWLENKFCNMATNAAKRYDVINRNDPSPGNVDEEEKSELEDHAAFAQLVLRAIGYKIFEPLPATPAPPKIESPAAQDDEEIFYLKRYVKKIGRTICATMKRTPEGKFVVLKGSDISTFEYPKLSESLKKRRRDDKTVKNGKLREDVEFNSSSTAAKFVLGNSVSGNEVWKTETL